MLAPRPIPARVPAATRGLEAAPERAALLSPSVVPKSSVVSKSSIVSLSTVAPGPTAPAGPDAIVAVQELLKCKWALLVLAAIAAGHERPSAIERTVPGISHKILHQRLAKLTRLQLVTRHEEAARMQRVAYRLSPFGRELNRIIAALHDLQQRCATPR